MNKVPQPSSEAKRLEVLHSLAILDTAESEYFNQVIDLAARVLNTPMAALSFVDIDRQWFKARKGIEVQETCREHAFCAHTICESSLFMVRDAEADPRFQNNPLVLAQGGIKSYLGVPIVIERQAVGSLCVLDTVPREFSTNDILNLRRFGRVVVQLLKSA